jgi:hypothetical protein
MQDPMIAPFLLLVITAIVMVIFGLAVPAGYTCCS